MKTEAERQESYELGCRIITIMLRCIVAVAILVYLALNPQMAVATIVAALLTIILSVVWGILLLGVTGLLGR